MVLNVAHHCASATLSIIAVLATFHVSNEGKPEHIIQNKVQITSTRVCVNNTYKYGTEIYVTCVHKGR